MGDKVLIAYEDCTYYGTLSGLIVADREDYEEYLGREVHWGEVLGKHSSVTRKLTEQNFTIIADDQDLIKKLIAAFEVDESRRDITLLGYNPINQIRCRDEEYDEQFDD